MVFLLYLIMIQQKLAPSFMEVELTRAPQMVKNIMSSIVVDNSSYSYTLYTITSAAIKLCYCWDHIPDCSLCNLRRTLFPGQVLEVEVACVDQIEQPVPCNIQSDFDMNNIKLGQ